MDFGQVEALDQQVLPGGEPGGVVDEDLGKSLPAGVGHGRGSVLKQAKEVRGMAWTAARPALASGLAVGYVTGTHSARGTVEGRPPSAVHYGAFAAIAQLARGRGTVGPVGPRITTRRICQVNPFDLSGKVAVVTGGNGGIGLGIAHGLARAGASIVIVGRNEAKSGCRPRKLQEACGSETLVVTADLAQPRRSTGR